MDKITLSQKLAKWSVNVRYEDLPQAVIKIAKRSIIDCLGVSFDGAKTERAIKISHCFFPSLVGSGPSAVQSDLSLSSTEAAFLGGVSASILEFDDGHSQATIHPGATSIPAILAVAEDKKASVKDIVLAVAVAYEISARLGMDISLDTIKRGFHCTPLVGVIASAIGVAKILQLNEWETTNAIGLAGSNASGLFDYHGGWPNAWCISIGRANRNGVESALLAESGILGPIDVLDGSKGVGYAFTGREINVDEALINLGKRWHMLETSVKLYPCCRRSHAAIDAALLWRVNKQGVDIISIKKIIVETSSESALLNCKYIDSTTTAQMSIPFAVAVSIAYGTPEVRHFDNFQSLLHAIQHIIDKIEVKKSESPSIADEKRFAARVIFFLESGEICTETVFHPKGDPKNPVADRELEMKFFNLVAHEIGSVRSREIFDSLRDGGDNARSFMNLRYLFNNKAMN